jgi:hypothetical protein
MNNLEQNHDAEQASGSNPESEQGSSGPNLFLVYTLLALAILAAIGFAAMVVWPFYARR